MELCESFASLSLKGQDAHIFTSTSIQPPWIMIESSNTEYSLGDFIIIKKADETESLYRILKVSRTTLKAEKYYISEASLRLCGFVDGENIVTRKLGTKSGTYKKFISIHTKKGLVPDDISLHNLKAHGLYFQGQLVSVNPYIEITSTNPASDVVFIGNSCEITLADISDTFSDRFTHIVPLGGKLWISNVTSSEMFAISYHCQHLGYQVVVLSRLHPSKVTEKIEAALSNSNNIIILDDVGLYKDERFSRLIFKNSIILKDLQDLCTSTSKPSGNDQVLEEWKYIAGYRGLIATIRKHIESIQFENPLNEKIGIPSPKGILLYGPPGCSKTMIAKAIATTTKIGFISVKGPEIFSKWVGDSEKAIAEVFRKAKRQAPCVVFFDEFDSIGSSRSSDSKSSVESRVVSQLLSEIDGLSGMLNVLIVAATNRPDVIDSALLRPGRLDLHFHVPLPDVDSRREIIEMYTKDTCVSEDFSGCIDGLAKLSAGCSGAEIAAWCKKLIVEKIKGEDIRLFIQAPSFINRAGN